jgi:hypothetical protein
MLSYLSSFGSALSFVILRERSELEDLLFRALDNAESADGSKTRLG